MDRDSMRSGHPPASVLLREEGFEYHREFINGRLGNQTIQATRGSEALFFTLS